MTPVNDQCVAGSCAGTPTFTEAVDQQQPLDGSGFGPADGPFWQEFVPSVTGKFTKLTIWKNGLTGTENITVNVYASVGPSAPSKIYSTSLTLPNVQTLYDIVFPNPPTLTKNVHYTWEIIDPSQSLHQYIGLNNYPAGTSGAELYLGGAWDLRFRAYMIADCPQ